MATPETQEVRVKGWNDLQHWLFADSWNAAIGRFRSRYAFRGVSDAGYRLETTLIRLGGCYDTLERHMLRAFRKYAHRNLVQGDSIWHWLSVAQHYGLPTRLLDWTYSPLVAMHFATANIDKSGVDGAIWALNYEKTHGLLPDPLKAVLEGEGANVFTVQMLAGTLETLAAMDAMTGGPFVLFFEPPSMDDRIVNQFAFFSVMSDPCTFLDDWLMGHSELWRKVIIPAEIKWEVRDKLDQANITERVLFPGLDGLSRWLKRHYSPREPEGATVHRFNENLKKH
jgi:hypothetical protein